MLENVQFSNFTIEDKFTCTYIVYVNVSYELKFEHDPIIVDSLGCT